MKYKFDDKVYDSLQDYLIALKSSKNRYNSYATWTQEDDDSLVKLSNTMSLIELCDHFKRMPGGIKSRLRKLDSIDTGFHDDESSDTEANIDDKLEEASLVFLTAILKDADPNTGEVFDDSSIWKHPKIKDDIRTYLEKHSDNKKK